MKYTKEELEKYVIKSKYLSDMIRLMGMTPNSGNSRYLSKRIKLFKIDTTHWMSHSEKSRTLNNSNKRKKKPSEWLVLCNKSKPLSNKIRNAMIECNIEYKCSECGIGPEYNNKKLVIQIDHINGNNLDNRLENLRFLCPNCHSQTDNFMVKNAKLKIIQKKTCEDCNEKINRNHNKCRKCSGISHRKTKHPTDTELEILIWEKPTSQIAKDYNVSDKAVEKWCKKYNIEKPPRGYWQKIKKKNNVK